jgi:transcriptional regulator with XRE-family HTH domain
MPKTSGLDLKLARVREGLTVVAVAAQMGLSRQSVHGLERAAIVTPERALQYRAAVEALRDITEASA